DGMTDALITDLAQISSLKVISRTSAMHYKGTRKTLPEIARELNVDAVVEGAVLRSGDRVRITAQLIRTASDQHLWAEAFEGELRDALTLQSDVARAITNQIRAKLTQQPARLERNVSPQAYQLYLKGRYFWNKRTGEGFKTAIQYFDQAIAEQPAYAAAYAGLADSYLLLGGYYVVSQNESIPMARTAAQKALELDSSLADAHATLGLIAMNYDWNWTEAERQYRQAIALNPNYPTAHHWYAEYLTLVGRSEESLAEIQVAQQLDPLSLIISSDRGKYLHMRRQYDGAIAQFRKTLKMDPNYVQAHIYLAFAQIEKHMFAQTIADLEKIRVSDDSRLSVALLIYAYAAVGRRAEAMRTFSELKRLAGREHVDPTCFIVSYLGLGDNEQALSWLEKAYAEHSVALTGMKVAPMYDPLRTDPRFQDLQRRIGLPP